VSFEKEDTEEAHVRKLCEGRGRDWRYAYTATSQGMPRAVSITEMRMEFSIGPSEGR
jgi:hypothetical protein